MTSYEKFMKLCISREVKPTRALEASGLSRSLGSKWKQTQNYTPNIDCIQKLCRYFGVSADYFISENPEARNFFSEPPEFVPLVKAGFRMTHEQRITILKFAQFTYPEAFNEVQEV